MEQESATKSGVRAVPTWVVAVCSVLWPLVGYGLRTVYYLPGFWQPGWQKFALDALSIALSVLVFQFFASRPLCKKNLIIFGIGFWASFALVLSVGFWSGPRLGFRERFRAERAQYQRAITENIKFGSQYQVQAPREATVTIWPWIQDRGILYDPTDSFPSRSTSLDGFEPRRATRLEPKWFFVRR